MPLVNGPPVTRHRPRISPIQVARTYCFILNAYHLLSDFAQTVKQQADIVKVIEGYIQGNRIWNFLDIRIVEKARVCLNSASYAVNSLVQIPQKSEFLHRETGGVV